MGFILENLDQPLTLAQVSHAAHLSKFHFHRTFALLAAETVGHFIMRKRLEAAALRLAYERDRDVTDIALSSGYSSPSNFSKAFAGYYGFSPSAVRAPRSQLPFARSKVRESHGLALRPEQLYELPSSPSTVSVAHVQQNVRFIRSEEIPLCCLPLPRGAQHEALGPAFQRLSAYARELGIPEWDCERFGLRFEHELLAPPALRRYHVCVRCWKDFLPPAPLVPNFVSRGPYAVFKLTANSRDEYAKQYYAIYAHWPRDRSMVTESRWPVERFGPHTTGAPFEAEIWIKVRPRR